MFCEFRQNYDAIQSSSEASRSLGEQIHDPLSPNVKFDSKHNEDERGMLQECAYSPRTPPFHISSHDENAADEKREGSTHAQDDFEMRPRKRQRLSSVPPSVNALPSSLPASSSHITSSRPFGTPFPRIKAQASTNIRVYTYAATPPSVSELLSSLQAHGIPTKIYQDPWYSIESDAPEHPREYAGLVYHLKGGTGTSILKEWSSTEDTTQKDIKLHPDGISGWEYASAPPSTKEVRRWLEFNKLPSPVRKPKKPSQARLSPPAHQHN
ncbi:hypothetical protein PHLCEN_2v427 [Hermanssonia centrifuga]|uniref:Uncharacterized protein n=1 Tax=Hermanssonia centrifuga TaxID=98765 RepID=A0A2R6S617_9APHY|nr:hypothetical protein PHLCEN_2v427 [Hermanssonia centrifuga]